MNTQKVGIPRIDPSVKYVGVSKLRTLNASNLQDLDTTLVIQDNDQPIAVVLSYDLFMQMQQERERALTTLEMLVNKDERNALSSGIKDVLSKKTKSVSAVREAVRKKPRR